MFFPSFYQLWLLDGSHVLKNQHSHVLHTMSAAPSSSLEPIAYEGAKPASGDDYTFFFDIDNCKFDLNILPL